jgi:hypothetical protein
MRKISPELQDFLKDKLPPRGPERWAVFERFGEDLRHLVEASYPKKFIVKYLDEKHGIAVEQNEVNAWVRSTKKRAAASAKRAENAPPTTGLTVQPEGRKRASAGMHGQGTKARSPAPRTTPKIEAAGAEQSETTRLADVMLGGAPRQLALDAPVSGQASSGSSGSAKATDCGDVGPFGGDCEEVVESHEQVPEAKVGSPPEGAALQGHLPRAAAGDRAEAMDEQPQPSVSPDVAREVRKTQGADLETVKPGAMRDNEQLDRDAPIQPKSTEERQRSSDKSQLTFADLASRPRGRRGGQTKR